MKREKLRTAVRDAMEKQCAARGYAAPVDVLMDIGYLSREQYENWRFGRVPCLERVCTCGPGTLAFILKHMHAVGSAEGLKPSFTFYRKYGKGKLRDPSGKQIPLRFTLHGNPEFEKWYATHYVGTFRSSRKPEDASDPSPRTAGGQTPQEGE